MHFRIETAEDASEALSYFNHFHDSFLESLTLRVLPERGDEFGFGLPVSHEATIYLVHANYPAMQGRDHRRQRIEFRLAGIRRLNIGDFVPLDNMLQSCLIEVKEDGSIDLDIGGDGLITFTCESLSLREVDRSEAS